MHHRIDLMLHEQARDQRVISGVADDQLTCRDGLPKAFNEVIEDNNAFAGFAQLSDDMTPNVAGTAGD
jgi:hypothetical protein